MRTTGLLAGTTALALTIAGCDDGSPSNQGGAGGQGGASSSSSGAGGQGGASSSSSGTGGMTATGSGGTGGGPICTPGDATACDDQDPCTEDACSAGACAHSPAPAGTPCGAAMVCDSDSVCIASTAAWGTRFTGVDAFGGIAVDGAGSMSLVGSFASIADLGGGPLTSAGNSDVFVVRLDPFGNHVWSKGFGDAGWQQGNDIAVNTEGDIVIAGDFWGDLDFGGGVLPCHGAPGSPVGFLAKLGGKGEHRWSRCLSNDGQNQTFALTMDAAGNTLITGYFAGTIDFGAGSMTSLGPGSDVFVASFDAGGQVLWSRSFHLGTQDARDVAVDAAGNVFLSGAFIDAINVADMPLLEESGFHTFVMKLDATGTVVWARSFGDASQQTTWKIGADAAGNLHAAGAFLGALDLGGPPLVSEGGTDAFAAKLDPDGNHLWSQRFGGAGDDWAHGLALDATGAPVFAGSFASSIDLGGGPLMSAGGDDIFVAKLDADGQHLFSKRFGDGAGQQAFRAAAAGPGDALIFGRFAGNIDFGNGPITSNGASDAFVGRVMP